jgi:mannose-1-phosphate guanylyltransferase
VQKAFVLGAGLGTRLQSLTEFLPKPLIPVYQRPLISFAFEHLRRAGVSKFVVNTHHCARAYHDHFPDGSFEGCPIHFAHEEILLETGGGIDNVADHLRGGDFIVYNGDILTDLPLAQAIAAHEASDNLVTMVLRSTGAALQVACDPVTGKITDIGDRLGTGATTKFQFTGIYICRPEFLGWLHHGEKHSVILPFCEIIEKENCLGGVIVDEGDWWDLGTRETYMEAHMAIEASTFPLYGVADWKQRIHSGAEIAADAVIDDSTFIGEGAVVGARARVSNSLIWPRAKVAAGADLDNCIVRSGQCAEGKLSDVNI